MNASLDPSETGELYSSVDQQDEGADIISRAPARRSRLGNIISTTAAALFLTHGAVGCLPATSPAPSINTGAKEGPAAKKELLQFNLRDNRLATIDPQLLINRLRTIKGQLFYEKLQRFGLLDNGPFTKKDLIVQFLDRTSGETYLYGIKVDVTITQEGLVSVVGQEQNPKPNRYEFFDATIKSLVETLARDPDCKEKGRDKCTTPAQDFYEAKKAKVEERQKILEADDLELIERVISNGKGIAIYNLANGDWSRLVMRSLRDAFTTRDGIPYRRLLIFHKGKPLVITFTGTGPTSFSIHYLDKEKTNKLKNTAAWIKFIYEIVVLHISTLETKYKYDTDKFAHSPEQEAQRNALEGGKYQRAKEVTANNVKDLNNAMKKVGIDAFSGSINSGSKQYAVAFKKGEMAIFGKTGMPSPEDTEIDQFIKDHANPNVLQNIALENYIEAFQAKYNVKLITDKLPQIPGVKAKIINNKEELWKKLHALPSKLGIFPPEVREKLPNRTIYVVRELKDSNGKSLAVKSDGDAIAVNVNHADLATELNRNVFMRLDKKNTAADKYRKNKAKAAGTPYNYYSTDGVWAFLPGPGTGFNKFKNASSDQARVAIALLSPTENQSFRQQMTQNKTLQRKGELITGLKFNPKTGEFTDTELTKHDYFGRWSKRKGSITMNAAFWNNPGAKAQNEKLTIEPQAMGYDFRIPLSGESTAKAAFLPSDPEIWSSLLEDKKDRK